MKTRSNFDHLLNELLGRATNRGLSEVEGRPSYWSEASKEVVSRGDGPQPSLVTLSPGAS